MIYNLLKNFCLITFALIAPITLPAGGIQKSLNQNNLIYISYNYKLPFGCNLYLTESFLITKWTYSKKSLFFLLLSH